MLKDALIIGLASWRLAHLLVYEDGPADLIEKLRQFIGLRPGEIKGFLPGLFSCMYCMSVWAVAASYLVFLLCPTAVMLGAAATIVMMAEAFDKRST